MAKDFEYFTEFLANPAAVEDDHEFHRMAREWGRYLLDHKGEFNYLEDDEWKEIRERLLDEMYEREDYLDDRDDEFEEIKSISDNFDNLSRQEKNEFADRHLRFMKTYQDDYQFTDEQIAKYEQNVKRCREADRAVKIAEEKAKFARLRYQKSIAKLDDQLVESYELTGKFPVLPWYPDKKRHKGN